jgi:hypothetical protein
MSKVQEYRQAEEELKVKVARLEEMRPKYEEFKELVDFILADALAKGIDPQSIALAIAPNLSKGTAKVATKSVSTDGRTTRKARVKKVYMNPESGEKVETKGGNHKVLKAWKNTYGANTVDGWLVK